MGLKRKAVALVWGALVLGGCAGSVAGSVTPGGAAGMSAASLATLYQVGKTWTYNYSAAGVASTMSWEVTAVKDNKATIKTTLNLAGGSQTNTATIDLAAKNPYANASASTGDAQVTTTMESVTVPAGTFSCTKLHSTSSASGVASTVDSWFDVNVGLVKQVTQAGPVSVTLELASHS